MSGVRMIQESEVREPGSYETIALLRVTRSELVERGVRLTTPPDDGTWDEAGPIQEALIEVETGEQPLLIWHLVFEAEETDARSPLDLRAPISTSDPAAFAEAVVSGLGLAKDRCEWVIPLDDWRHLQRYAEDWRAWKSGRRSESPKWPTKPE